MSKRSTNRVLAVGLVVVAGAAAAGCSSSHDYSGGAKKYIEGDLEKQIDLGELTATCDDVPKDAAVGDTFNCTADTSDGQTIEFLVTISEKDKVNVETTNLISADGMTTLETSALKLIAEQTGATFDDGALDCGDGARVIDVTEESLTCSLLNPDASTFNAPACAPMHRRARVA